MRSQARRGRPVTDERRPTEERTERFLRDLLRRVSAMDAQLHELRREIVMRIRASELSDDPDLARLVRESVRLEESGELANGPGTPKEWIQHFEQKHAAS